jgi:hypothetical protein
MNYELRKAISHPVIPRLTRDSLPGRSTFNREIAGQARNDRRGKHRFAPLVYSFTRLLVYSFTL